MRYWTITRWISFAVHAALAALLLAWSLSAAFAFWSYLFTDAAYAVGATVALDSLAFIGFLLYILHVDSPLVHTRHLLPVASTVPLLYEMHQQFAHLGSWTAWTCTVIITVLLSALAFVVWGALERLFVHPVDAAREYAARQMQGLQIRQAQLEVMQDATDILVQQHMQRALPVQVYPRPAVPPMQPVQVPMQVTMQDASNDAGVQTTRLQPMQEDVVNAVASMQDASDAVQPVQGDAVSASDDAGTTDDYAAVLQMASQIENPAFTYNDERYRCAKCGAINDAPEGKSAQALRKSSGRYGCPSCKNIT